MENLKPGTASPEAEVETILDWAQVDESLQDIIKSVMIIYEIENCSFIFTYNQKHPNQPLLQAAGKRTGFVTTTRMSHATPAALYAKTVHRLKAFFYNNNKSIQLNTFHGSIHLQVLGG